MDSGIPPDRISELRAAIMDPGPQSPFHATKILQEYLTLQGIVYPATPNRVWKTGRQEFTVDTKQGKRTLVQTFQYLDFP
jgi:hypothetical protein